MKLKLAMSFVILGFVFSSLSVEFSQAQSPLGTAEDNACYPGGSLEGKCATEWEWVCGWYLARWEKAGGWLNPNNTFIRWCESLLPPRPLDSQDGLGLSTSAIVICHTTPLATWCLSSAQTGTLDASSDGSIDTEFLFGDFVACPIGYPNGPFLTFALTGGGTFTLDELFVILALGPNNCTT